MVERIVTPRLADIIEATPAISPDCIMKTAGLIEQMGRVRLGLRNADM
jgi:hypothetical protein